MAKRELTLQSEQPPLTQLFSRNEFIGFATGTLGVMAVAVFLAYSNNKSLDIYTTMILSPIVVMAFYLSRTVFSAWRTPKHLTFHNDHLEIVSMWRRVKIPYTDIVKAELVPNPWAPANSNRNFLKIYTNGKFGSYTLRGFELSTEEVLATLQPHIQ